MKYRIVVGSMGLLIVALLTVSVYQYRGNIYRQQESREIASRLLFLENQAAVFTKALQSSSMVSEENKQQLQEIANRKTIVERSQEELLTSAVAHASKAVVSIVISKDVPLLEVQYANPFGDDPFFRDFGFSIPTYRQVGTQKQKVGAGTGFIVREDGYVVTNRHVVDDKQADYVALLSTGEQKTARVLYRDATYDLAILKIDGGGYPKLSLGNSSSLKLGQTVAAIGNALGEYNNSVSVGIISGLDRTIQAQDSSGAVETLSGVIQTDAAINPGNSGGPLLDLSGAAVGVNVAVERGANNIAFAIPVDTLEGLLAKVLP